MCLFFCVCINKTTFIESIRSYGKVYESRQRIATSKFNEYMLKVIEAYRHQLKERYEN
jgi:GTP-binding protein